MLHCQRLRFQDASFEQNCTQPISGRFLVPSLSYYCCLKKLTVTPRLGVRVFHIIIVFERMKIDGSEECLSCGRPSQQAQILRTPSVTPSCQGYPGYVVGA